MVDRLDLVNLLLGGGRWTWSNRRENPSWSRIDRFLISNSLLLQCTGLSQKLLNRPIFDHFPICLIPKGIIWGPTPFGLDNKWLRIENFTELVKNFWQETAVVGTSSDVFVSKLKALKNEIKRWARVEESRLERTLNDNLIELVDCDNMKMRGILGEHGRVRREFLRKEIAEVCIWRQFRGDKKLGRDGLKKGIWTLGTFTVWQILIEIIIMWKNYVVMGRCLEEMKI